MDGAYGFTWKYFITITHVMEPESISSSPINHNYSIFQSKLIFELQRSED